MTSDLAEEYVTSPKTCDLHYEIVFWPRLFMLICLWPRKFFSDLAKYTDKSWPLTSHFFLDLAWPRHTNLWPHIPFPGPQMFDRQRNKSSQSYITGRWCVMSFLCLFTYTTYEIWRSYTLSHCLGGDQNFHRGAPWWTKYLVGCTPLPRRKDIWLGCLWYGYWARPICVQTILFLGRHPLDHPVTQGQDTISCRK